MKVKARKVTLILRANRLKWILDISFVCRNPGWQYSVLGFAGI